MSITHSHAVFKVRDVPGGIVVDLPSPRRILTALVVGMWLAGWLVGVSFVAQQLREAEPRAVDRVFLVAWAIVWLAAGVFAFGYLFWLLAGRERVTLREGRLRIWRGVWGVGFAREYPAAGISELRTFGRELVPLLALGLDLSGQGASGVRFRCGGRVVRFARALDEHSAHALVDRLRAGPPFARQPGAPVEPAA